MLEAMAFHLFPTYPCWMPWRVFHFHFAFSVRVFPIFMLGIPCFCDSCVLERLVAYGVIFTCLGSLLPKN